MYLCTLYAKEMTRIKTYILLAIALVALGLKLDAQCTISYTGPSAPICSGESVTLTAESNSNYTYLWTYQNGDTIAFGNNYYINQNPDTTTTYLLTISDADENIICESDYTVEVKKMFEIVFHQRQLTCSNSSADNGQTAAVEVEAYYDDETPGDFHYQWNLSPLHIVPGNEAMAIGLAAYHQYSVTITDNNTGCSQTASTKPRAYPNPIVNIIAIPNGASEPSDTAYIQNPHVKFTFEEEINDSIDCRLSGNHTWKPINEVSSQQQEYTFTYTNTGEYEMRLKVESDCGCDTTYTKTIHVMPVKLKIPNVFTPNGDGINDYFIISLEGDDGGGNMSSYNNEYEGYKALRLYYEKTEVTVFNRWGSIVFRSDDYENDWDGGKLSDGTYYYVIKCHGYKDDKMSNKSCYKGSVTIIGSGR